ncbi:centromere-associated protein E isoform X2 [Talpa occidentalis]|uniref:centromere-associated protein E isoform X2 n=1 Tax=Talpa occidentalis TaxID=50954 RepID=UPI0023F657D5|nr:centromere-associated protein E isoform X2 [Talpa occidentalis]
MAEEGAVAVCVRVRPLNSREEALGEETQVYWKTDNNVIYQVDGSKSFNFDRVFHSNETTKNVYEEIAVPIIDSAIQGYNGTIFAYGQTASGKTYTMMGSKEYLGVIPRAIHDIFQKIKKFPDREFLLRVSYMEIYNETITDLLCDTQKMKPLIIREDFNRNVYVSDLTEEVVYTSEMALKWITKGEKNRHYGITKMNQRSSRSHTIFRMILESREKGEPSNCDGSVKVSHLNLVDLADSERAAQTGAEGVRLKEGCNINRSLFILGQVIKRLSDGQVGGFINYRDSKLTRILQNSLGGNAKTRIICTITPVSYDETLTTLQFASTAKYMKNTPYVNEVSSDEALLKRYRKEIMDLKKQLEEVSLETRAQAMEKDQLAQLLEEKDLLQKVQIEKIQNLTRMLVTSSSLTSQQELKAKRKRRVTWCLGKINKMKDSNYVDEFNVPANVTTKSQRATLTVLGEIDESLCSESDVFSNTLDTLTEVEWNPATKLLSQENLESELNSLRANYDNLVLDYEQLRRENEEMELKLKEKNDLDEFEALERKAEKDQEMQLIHEISNLKNLVKHAEVYNQDLESELSSKVEMLKEKEDQIKKLQKYIDSQQSENTRMDLSYSSENTDDLKQMKQTLLDVETVALDSKRESAFLRSENLELKEKMKELASTCNQMENDIHAYQRQLETKKKMQVDLEKELQSSYNEIAKLTSLMDGKIPKDLLCNLELERKIADLQKELNKGVEENEALRNEINTLSELKPLTSEIEMLRKEIRDKSEELSAVTSEKDRLFSEVVHKESRIQDLLEEIGKAKDDLAATQTDYKGTGQDIQDFKNHHIEFEQKYEMVLEENLRMNQEIGNLSKEVENLGVSLAALKTELSHKTQELQQKTTESQERLGGMEQLKAQLESSDSRLQTLEMEKAVATEKLQQTLEEVRALTQEKDELRQLQERLQVERDQLRSDIQDTVHMNIETQEQLRDALQSLKQHQETINTLKMKISDEASRDVPKEGSTGETEGEFQGKVSGVGAQSWDTRTAQMLIAGVEDREQQRKILSLVQEKEELQQVLERVSAEKEQLKADLKESIEMTIENQEELRILRDELKKQQEIVTQEKDCTIQKDELSRTCEKLLEVEERLKEKSQQLEERQQQLLIVQEEVNEMQKKMNDIENLKNELKNQELTLERTEMERLDLAQKLHENCEEIKSLTKERNDLKELQDSFEIEREKLKGYIREIELTGLETKEELKVARIRLKEHQETIDELRNTVEKTSQMMTIQNLEKSRTELQCKTPEPPEQQELLAGVSEVDRTRETVDGQATWEEPPGAENSAVLASVGLQESPRERKSPTEERDNLQRTKETLEAECEQLKEDSRGPVANAQESQENQELSFSMEEKGSEAEKTTSEEGASEAPFRVEGATLPELGAGRLSLSQGLQEALQAESDQLRENLGEVTAKHQETEKELRIAHHHLKEHEETIHQLKVALCERETELSSMQKELETAHNELQKKDLEIQEELETARMSLKEQQETIDKLRGMVSEKTDEISSIQMDLENTNSFLKSQVQELQEKEHQLLEAKHCLTENIYQTEQLRKEMEAQNSTLGGLEAEKLLLTQKLHENLKEIEVITMERDGLRRAEGALQTEQEQLRESLQAAKTKDLETQEELKSVYMCLKEQQETIDKLQGVLSEKTDEISSMQVDLENKNTELEEKIQELKSNEQQLLKLKEAVSETQKKMPEMERLKTQLKTQSLTLDKMEMENLNLAQKLHENLEEMKSVTRERDRLRRMEEMLILERDQLRGELQGALTRDQETQGELKTAHVHLKEHQETISKLRERLSEKTTQISCIQEDLNKAKDELQKKQDQQNHKAVVKCGKTSVCDGRHLTENLRGKCFRIKELLKKYPEMDNQYKCLSRLSRHLEKEIETQKELSARIKANLPLPSPQTKEIQKLLATNQRCSMEFLRVIKKFEYVLSQITKFKEENHESINKFEMAVVDEVEKQNELLIKIQHLQPDCDEPSIEIGDLEENLDLHAEEILSDLTENNFHNINTEFEEVLSNRKEMTQFLKEWLNTPVDTEKLKNGIQRKNDRLSQVNILYNNKIIAILNESTKFEERKAVVAKEWEQKLKSMKEINEKLFKNYKTLKIPQTSVALVNPAPQDDKNHVIARAPQPTSERIQELEASLREAKDSARHKESKIIKMQKELEMMTDVIAKLQGKVNESNECLEKTKEMMQALQDKAVLGAKPYKEEIEDLKTKLVKVDLEKMKLTKEFEKEMTSVKAAVDYQKEVIRVLRENLRRNQQAQDTSMVSEHTESQPANKPLTCGGGSGIVQSTKALILKSEYVRLEKENSKLKQQNEQLLKENDELLSNNHHLSNEVRTWKERTLKRDPHSEAAREISPKSPKVAGMVSKRRHRTPSQCKERNRPDPAPQESPKSWFFDSRTKSFPAPHPVRYFDNSGLGLCPEQTTGAENVAPQPGAWLTSSESDMPECKTQ